MGALSIKAFLGRLLALGPSLRPVKGTRIWWTMGTLETLESKQAGAGIKAPVVNKKALSDSRFI